MTLAKHLAYTMALNYSNGRIGIIVLTTTQLAISVSLTTKGTTEERDHTSTPKLVHVSTKITKDFLVLKEASWFEDGDAKAPHVSESFMKATVAADFPTIVPFLKGNGDAMEYITGSYPASFFFGGAKEGATLGPNGKGVDKVLNQCEEHLLDLTHWYKVMHSFVIPAHDAMIMAAAAMKTHLPMKKQGGAYAFNELAVVTRLSDDNEDGELNTASTAILLACEKTAADNTQLAAGIATENTINTATILRSVRRGLDTSSDGDATFATCTVAGWTSAKKMQCMRLLIVHSNAMLTGVHFGPKVPEEDEEIIKCSNKKHQTSFFGKHLLLREDKVFISVSAASSRVSVPKFDRLQIAFVSRTLYFVTYFVGGVNHSINE